jgi:hypothetical protein
MDWLEQYPCEDWYDVPSDEMTLEQARQAVKERTKKHACVCISKQAVLDGLASIAKVKAKSDAQKSLMGRAIFFVEKLPPVTPQQKMGRWIVHPKGIYSHLVCDKCLSNAPYDCQTNYCPNCGAKMESEET